MATPGGPVTQDLATQRGAVDTSQPLVLGRVQRGGKTLIMLRYPDGRVEYVEERDMPGARVGAPVGGAPSRTPSEDLMTPPAAPQTTMTAAEELLAPQTSLRPQMRPQAAPTSMTSLRPQMRPQAAQAPAPTQDRPEDFNMYIAQQAERYGIPLPLAQAVITQESGGKQSAVSPKGATGIMQLMPATAKELGVDMNDPYQNIEGGMRYLSQQYKEFGTWPLALAAYNAGPNAVKKYGDVPPFEETTNYVDTIMARANMAPIIMTGSDRSEARGESPEQASLRLSESQQPGAEPSYGMFGDMYASQEARNQADAEMLKESTKANREVAGDSMFDYLSDALEYLDLSGLAKGPKMPSSVGPGVYRPRGGAGTRALQRMGIASLV